MGDIGEEITEIELEPLPEDEPAGAPAEAPAGPAGVPAAPARVPAAPAAEPFPG